MVLSMVLIFILIHTAGDVVFFAQALFKGADLGRDTHTTKAAAQRAR
jgi:hypothetical protein